MTRKNKYNKLICAMLVSAITFAGSSSVFATELEAEDANYSEIITADASTDTSDTLDVSVYANYYASEGDGNYKIIFTSMTDIPEFVNMNCTISLSGATVSGYEILTDYSGKSVTDSTSAITYTFNRTASGIRSVSQLFSLTINGAASVPSADILTITDFSVTAENGTTTTINPTLTFHEGDIIPELTDAEQEIYDEIVSIIKEYPTASNLSFYTTNQEGKKSLFQIDAYIERVAKAQADYESLADKENVNDVLEFYRYDVSVLTELHNVLNAMYGCRGLIETSYLMENLTEDNILNYQFLFNVYEAKKNISLSGLESTTAYSELQNTLTIYNGQKAILDTLLAAEDIDYETLVYSCKEQLKIIQGLSDDLYYSDYLTALKSVIDVTYVTVDDNYTGNAETRRYLLSCLDNYTDEIELIENGAKDIPVMTVGLVTYQQSYTVTFERSQTLPDTLVSSLRIVVTDTSGNVIDETTSDFSSNLKKKNVGMYASKENYPPDKVITITAYYILDNASFLIGSFETKCAVLASSNPAPGIGISATIPSAPSGNGGSASSSGGTRFPSNQENIDKDAETNTDIQRELFADVSSQYDWAKDAIEGLYYAGIINGMEEGIFNPAGIVTREQFSKMVVQLFGIATTNTKTSFVDVNADAWYAPYVTAALQAGYIQGQSNEYFGIGESIMRQDMATILYRALGDSNSKAVLNFSDSDSIADYAKDAIAELVGLGIINGYEDGTFKPRGTATRAEAAKMIWGVYQIIKN